MRRFTLGQLLLAIVTLAILTVFAVRARPLLWCTFTSNDPIARDCMNLKQLWVMQANYRTDFGGGHPSPHTGSEFWTCLTRTNPPLIDPSLGDIYDCPVSPTRGDAAHCEYRGPVSDVNLYADNDPVGACDHGDDGIVVLRKSGDVMLYPRGDPVALAALERTRP